MADIPVPPDPEGRIIHGFTNNEDAVLVKAVVDAGYEAQMAE